MKEEWRVVPGYEEFEASSRGRIRMAEDQTIIRDKPSNHRDIPRYTMIALAFLGPKPDGWVTHHKDFRCTNDKPSNLEYLPKTKHRSKHVGSETIHYIHKEGEVACGFLKQARKVDSVDASLVTCETCKRIISSGQSQPSFITPAEAADILGVTPDAIRKLCKLNKIASTRHNGHHWRIEKTSVLYWRYRKNNEQTLSP